MEKKSYSISTSENNGIVEIVFTGEIKKGSIKEVVDELHTIIKPMNAKKLLQDFSSLKMPREYVEVYERVRKYPPHLCVKTAVVDLPQYADFESFHETTARNAGIDMKWFSDIDEARKWLKIQ
jgi:hypothetical protein